VLPSGAGGRLGRSAEEGLEPGEPDLLPGERGGVLPFPVGDRAGEEGGERRAHEDGGGEHQREDQEGERSAGQKPL
jgi:hypothetical protein